MAPEHSPNPLADAWRGVALGLLLGQQQPAPIGYWTHKLHTRDRWFWDGCQWLLQRDVWYEPVWKRVR